MKISVKKCFSIEKEHIQVRLNYCPFWFVNISHCDQKVERYMYKRSALQYQLTEYQMTTEPSSYLNA